MDPLEALPSLDLGERASFASFSSFGSMLERGLSDELNPMETSRFFQTHLPWLGDSEPGHGMEPGAASTSPPAAAADLSSKDSSPPWHFVASLSPFTEPWDVAATPLSMSPRRAEDMTSSPAPHPNPSGYHPVSSPSGTAHSQPMQPMHIAGSPAAGIGGSHNRMAHASFAATVSEGPRQTGPPPQPLNPEIQGFLESLLTDEQAPAAGTVTPTTHNISNFAAPGSTTVPWELQPAAAGTGFIIPPPQANPIDPMQPGIDTNTAPRNHAPAISSDAFAHRAIPADHAPASSSAFGRQPVISEHLSPAMPSGAFGHPDVPYNPIPTMSSGSFGHQTIPPDHTPTLSSSSLGHRAVITTQPHPSSVSQPLVHRSHTPSPAHSAAMHRPPTPALPPAPLPASSQPRVNPFLQFSVQHNSSDTLQQLVTGQVPLLPTSPGSTPSAVTSSQPSLADLSQPHTWAHVAGAPSGSYPASGHDSFARLSNGSGTSVERRVSRINSGASRQGSGGHGRHLLPSGSMGKGAASGGVSKEGGQHGQRRTKKDEIARLEAQLGEKLRLATRLQEENHALQRKERLLSLMMRTGGGGRGGAAAPLFVPRDGGGGGTAPHLRALIHTFRSSVTRMMSPQLVQQVQQASGSHCFQARDFCRSWQVFVSEVSEVLHEFGARGLLPTITRRMEEVCDRAQSWTASVCIYKPSAMLNVDSTNLVTMEPLKPAADFWQEVLARLALTEEQLVDLYHVYQIYAGALASIRAQEAALMAELTALVSREVRVKGSAMYAPLHTGLFHDNNVELQDVLDRAQAAVRQSHMLHFMSCFLFNALLTPLQRCLVIFHSMPSFPRYKMLLQAVACSLGDPAAQHMDD